jgi:hypothetical protein
MESQTASVSFLNEINNLFAIIVELMIYLLLHSHGFQYTHFNALQILNYLNLPSLQLPNVQLQPSSLLAVPVDSDEDFDKISYIFHLLQTLLEAPLVRSERYILDDQQKAQQRVTSIQFQTLFCNALFEFRPNKEFPGLPISYSGTQNMKPRDSIQDFILDKVTTPTVTASQKDIFERVKEPLQPFLDSLRSLFPSSKEEHQERVEGRVEGTPLDLLGVAIWNLCLLHYHLRSFAKGEPGQTFDDAMVVVYCLLEQRGGGRRMSLKDILGRSFFLMVDNVNEEKQDTQGWHSTLPKDTKRKRHEDKKSDAFKETLKITVDKLNYKINQINLLSFQDIASCLKSLQTLCPSSVDKIKQEDTHTITIKNLSIKIRGVRKPRWSYVDVRVKEEWHDSKKDSDTKVDFDVALFESFLVPLQEALSVLYACIAKHRLEIEFSLSKDQRGFHECWTKYLGTPEGYHFQTFLQKFDKHPQVHRWDPHLERLFGGA